MQRILIVGGPGAGKSWLAIELGRRLGLPVHHLDHIHWAPGWTARPRAERDWMSRELRREPAWVIEGDYARTEPEAAEAAEMLIWLDLPIGLRLVRLLTRVLASRHGTPRPDLPEGCEESFRRGFVELAVFAVKTRSATRERHLSLLMANAKDGRRVLRLGTPGAVRRLLSAFPPAP
ncbi:AAA family ATPase [Frigidibacter sp. MR17.14]|uniref:AAA family ATPase n=1 Tax=Frigidibacter sp. MR17.14 TaxID=3126509 RepID=UPI003012A62B